MATWKAILVVIIVGILLMAIGAWLGYRYISEQDEIRPTVQKTVFNTDYTLVHHILNKQQC